MQSVELTSGTVEYYESGRTGPTLVFLTGVLVGVTVWRHVIADLRADHRCIAVEMPLGAHRRPMKPDADLSSRGLAALVADFLTALDLAEVTLVGCDWGGAQLVAAYGLDARVARLARCRSVVVTTAESHRLPPENLISPDYIRRLAWSPPDEISAQTVSDTLRGFGARNWQVGLLAVQLAEALPDPVG